MDMVAVLGIAASIAGILSLLYVILIGQRSIPELFRIWLQSAASQQGGKDTEVTVRHNLPQPDYGEFVNRHEELAAVLHLLLPYPHSKFYLISIDGIGGVGKSALALRVAYYYLTEEVSRDERFDSIIWISAKDTILTGKGVVSRKHSLRTLDDLYLVIATVLEEKDIVAVSPDKRYEAVKRALAKQRVLLIVDNFESIDDDSVEAFLRELPVPTKVIVTTRHRVDVAYPITLLGLGWNDTQELIKNEGAHKGVLLTEEQSERLFSACGGLPLAVCWSIGLMSLGYSVESVLGRLENVDDAVIDFCFHESIAHIRTGTSYHLLIALSLFTTTASPEALRYITDTPQSVVELGDELSEIEQLSLISRESGRISMLPLTRRMAAAELEKQSSLSELYQARYVDYYCKLIEHSLGKDFWRSHDRWQDFPTVDTEIQNIETAIDLAYETRRWNDLLALTVPLVHYLHSRGLFESRLRQAKMAIEAAMAVGKPNTASLMYIASIGWIHIRRGEWERAIVEIEKGRALAYHHNFSDGIALANAHLARIALKEKRLHEARTLLSNIEGIDPSPVVETRIHFVWGLLAMELENWTEAENCLRVAIATLGHWTDYPWPALHIALGECLLAKGDLKEAEEIFDQSLVFSDTMARTTDTADAWFGLARVAYARGDLEQALDHAEKAMRLFKKYRSNNEVQQVQSFLRELKQKRPRRRLLFS